MPGMGRRGNVLINSVNPVETGKKKLPVAKRLIKIDLSLQDVKNVFQ